MEALFSKLMAVALSAILAVSPVPATVSAGQTADANGALEQQAGSEKGSSANQDSPSSQSESAAANGADKQTSTQQDTSQQEGSEAQSSSKQSTDTEKASEPKKSSAAKVYAWSNSEAPNYVKVIGKAKVSKAPAKGKVKYSSLDSLGRTRGAKATITYKMVADSAGWREDIPESEDPSGWGHNGTVSISLPNGRTYNGWFWNRSHLIADSLGGKAIRKNLVTGTRMQNVGANDGNGGMAYCETKVRNWIYDHPSGTVYYAATPVYKGDEIVPRNVIVDMKTSDGSINQRVVVFNYAKGYKINYSKGTYSGKKSSAKSSSGASSSSGKSSSNAGNSSSSEKSSKSSSSKASYVFITPTGSKYHHSNCPTLSRSKSLTKLTVSAAKSRGYEACKVCMR